MLRPSQYVKVGKNVGYPLLATVSANSVSMVNASSNLPDATGGFFYTTIGSGQWDADGESHLFAFRFQQEDSENECYGWAEVQRLDEDDGRLLQWAYDCEGSIKVGAVPEPGAMGLFALGAAGMAAFRRRRSAA